MLSSSSRIMMASCGSAAAAPASAIPVPRGCGQFRRSRKLAECQTLSDKLLLLHFASETARTQDHFGVQRTR